MRYRKRLAAITLAAGTLVLPATAYAGANYPTPTTVVDPSTQSRVQDPQVAGTQQSRGSSLPFTGADIAQLTLFGAGAVGAGAFLVRRSRRTA